MSCIFSWQDQDELQGGDLEILCVNCECSLELHQPDEETPGASWRSVKTASPGGSRTLQVFA